MERTTEVAGEVREGTMLPPAVVGATSETKKIKVLVAIDDSDFSFYALDWTLDNIFKNVVSAAGATPPELNRLPQDSGSITVVHVMQPYHPYVFPAGPEMFATNDVVDSVRKAQSEHAAGVLSRAMKMCKDKGAKADTLLLEGEVKDMLCEAAEQIHADLLVVGSRGLGMVKRAFLGSVSDYCAHHAKCPTLIVKPPKETHHHKESGPK